MIVWLQDELKMSGMRARRTDIIPRKIDTSVSGGGGGRASRGSGAVSESRDWHTWQEPCSGNKVEARGHLVCSALDSCDADARRRNARVVALISEEPLDPHNG